MKNKILISIIFTVFYFAPSFITKCEAQEIDVKKYRLLYKFKTIKLNDNKRLLEVSFIARNKKDKKDKLPVYEANIRFFTTLNDKEILLGEAKTSKEGIAQLIVPEDQKYLTYDGGKFNLIAIFKGSDKLKRQKKEITVQDVFITLDLTTIDSVKTVISNAFTIDSLGIKTPVKEAEINFYVESMLSKMKIEEGTIENGTYTFEFPKGIPGDVNGNLNIYAMIEDHDEYGDVEQVKSKDWGIINKTVKKSKNHLWSSAAPIWMYIVLSILLVGVWANYFYTIIYLFKIKKEGKTI